GFGGTFKTRSRFAHDREIVGVFERNGVEVGDGKFCGVVGEFGVSEEIVARAVHHAAVFGDAGVGIDVPTRGCGGDEHFASGGSGAAHGQPASGHAAAAARAVVVDVGIGGRL